MMMMMMMLVVLNCYKADFFQFLFTIGMIMLSVASSSVASIYRLSLSLMLLEKKDIFWLAQPVWIITAGEVATKILNVQSTLSVVPQSKDLFLPLLLLDLKVW